MSEQHPGLKPYRVSYHEEPGDICIFHFDCWAENADHAEEQAENAYPFPAEVISVIEITESEYHKPV